MRLGCFWLYVLLAWGTTASIARAQEPDEPTRPRFFERPVDLWGSGGTYPADRGQPRAAKGRPDPVSEWGQVVRLPDGNFAYRELPAPLVRVLEDPTHENVEAYLAWKLGRTRKILAAAEKIRSYRPARPPADEPATQKVPDRGTEVAIKPAEPFEEGPKPKLEVVYFHKKGCPPCGKQDEVLGAWLRSRPGIRFRVIEFGQEPELWREQRIRGTPSLLFREPLSGRSVVLSGLSDRAAVEGAAAEVLAVPRKENAP